MTSTSTFSKTWKLIRQSLDGTEQDYTQLSIPKAVFLLAVPMILELSLESVFAVVDIFFVSKLGENAIATVGLTESVITLVYSVGIGLSTAATAIVARRTGEKNPEAATHAGLQTIFIGVFVSLFITLGGVVYAADILRFMGASPQVVDEGSVFCQIMFGGSVSIMLLFLINGIFRGVGDAAMAMKSLWIASLVNIILCPILIEYYGLKGAAIATVIGRTSGVLYQFSGFFKREASLRILPKHFTVDWSMVRSIVSVAWPATFQFFIASGSWIILTRLVAEMGGTTASAGYQIAIRNAVFFILPAWGLSNAVATLVGQNLGANRPDRAEESVWLTTRYNIGFMLFVTILFTVFPHPIIRFFTQDEAIITFGVQSLRFFGMGYVFFGMGMVMTQALNGAGDTRSPTLINLVGFWIFQIPLAYLLALFLNLGTTGVFIAIPVAESAIALLALYVFKKGKWKEIKV